jgi:hypothetical protein
MKYRIYLPKDRAFYIIEHLDASLFKILEKEGEHSFYKREFEIKDSVDLSSLLSTIFHCGFEQALNI